MGASKKENKSYLEVSDVLTSQLELCKPCTNKKAEPATPHFLSLNQDIVAWSQEV
jgi:hypothetical protein